MYSYFNDTHSSGERVAVSQLLLGAAENVSMSLLIISIEKVKYLPEFTKNYKFFFVFH